MGRPAGVLIGFQSDDYWLHYRLDARLPDEALKTSEMDGSRHRSVAGSRPVGFVSSLDPGSMAVLPLAVILSLDRGHPALRASRAGLPAAQAPQEDVRLHRAQEPRKCRRDKGRLPGFQSENTLRISLEPSRITTNPYISVICANEN